MLHRYILLVGAIASADLFEPKYGIIVQNKDELLLPLLLETIPTPKVRHSQRHYETNTRWCNFLSYIAYICTHAGIPRCDRVVVARAAALRQSLPRHAAREVSAIVHANIHILRTGSKNAYPLHFSLSHSQHSIWSVCAVDKATVGETTQLAR